GHPEVARTIQGKPRGTIQSTPPERYPGCIGASRGVELLDEARVRGLGHQNIPAPVDGNTRRGGQDGRAEGNRARPGRPVLDDPPPTPVRHVDVSSRIQRHKSGITQGTRTRSRGGEGNWAGEGLGGGAGKRIVPEYGGGAVL